MKPEELRSQIEAMVEDLLSEIQDGIGDHIECLALTGSYAIGKISLSRPDINFFLALKPGVPADVYLRLGEIFTEIIHKYGPTLSVRPEFRPFKFPYPVYKEGVEVFVNPIIVNMEEAQGDFPFGLPKNFLAGVKSMRKVIYGNDVLADIDFKVDKGYIVQASFRDLSIFRLQLTRAPMSYDLNSDIALLFNESLTNGKMAMGFGVELVATPDELDSKSYLQYFADKEKMVDLYSQRYDKSTAEAAKVLLEARNNYDKWKNDKQKAYDVFTAAYNLTQRVWGKLLSVAFGGH